MEADQQSISQSEVGDKTPMLRLLVVEDHGELCGALKAYLGMLGHRGHFVGDVASAWHAAGEEVFDVLLCDIGLPDRTGWDLLRTLTENGRRPPHAIAMSVFNLGEDVAKSKVAGFALHLFKPFPTEDLKKALDAVTA